MSTFSQDPYGYANLDLYDTTMIHTFDVNFDKTSGLKVSESSPAAHPHLEGAEDGIYYAVCDAGSPSPDGEQPFTIFGPYGTRAAAQSLIDDGTATADSEIVRMFYDYSF